MILNHLKSHSALLFIFLAISIVLLLIFFVYKTLIFKGPYVPIYIPVVNGVEVHDVFLPENEPLTEQVKYVVLEWLHTSLLKENKYRDFPRFGIYNVIVVPVSSDKIYVYITHVIRFEYIYTRFLKLLKASLKEINSEVSYEIIFI